jgi:hypothetical protein
LIGRTREIFAKDEPIRYLGDPNHVDSPVCGSVSTRFTRDCGSCYHTHVYPL